MRKTITFLSIAFALLISGGKAEAQYSIYAFGFNPNGELGIGTTGNKLLPVKVGLDDDWIQVCTATSHSLAIKSNGTLWAWGWGGNGELGTGNTDTQPSPVQIGTDTNWVQVSVNEFNSLAIKSDGTLWAWGQGTYGKLGTGNTDNQLSPVQVGTDTNWEQVSAGAQHTLAIKSDGTLWAWGNGGQGKLGLGHTISQLSPVQVGTATNWAQVNTGFSHSLALKSDGTLWAWGNGGNGSIGYLGTGNTLDRTTPTQVGTATYLSVSTKSLHSLAIKSDGTLWAWGGGAYGKLGTGNTDSQLSPVQIGADTDWEHVAAGTSTTLAIKSDGTLWVWGYGGNGALGTGNTDNQLLPTQIDIGTCVMATAKNSRGFVLVSGLNSYEISVSANPPNGGAVSGGGVYDYGTEITVIATENTGYTFVNWTEDGVEVSTDLEYSFVVNSDRDLVANFTGELSVSDWESEKIILYPNPTNGILHISTKENISLEEVKIYNLQGRELFNSVQNLETIHIEDLSSGIYLMNIKTNQGTISKRVIKK